MVEWTDGDGEGILREGGVEGLVGGGSRIDGNRLGICKDISNGFEPPFCRSGCLNISPCREIFVPKGSVTERIGPVGRTGSVDGWTNVGVVGASFLSRVS